MPLGFSRGGVIADSVYLATSLANTNVHTKEGPRSYSQQGDFTSALRVDPTTIDTSGPNTDYPTGKLIKRHWVASKRMKVFFVNGQSNTVGGNNSFFLPSPITNFTVLNPLENFQCFVGGLIPTQTGSDSPGVTTIIDAQNYATLVAAREAINTYRTTPAADVANETWSTSFGEVIAAAVTPDNVVLVANVGHGATTFDQDILNTRDLATATWLAGVGTFTITGGTALSAGQTFEVVNATPTAWRATYTVLTANGDGSVVTAAVAVNPGTYVASSGNTKTKAAPMVNCMTMMAYIVGTLAPAMGLTVDMGGFLYNGNESASQIPDEDTLEAQYDIMRAQVDEIGALSGTVTPWIIWPQVGYPRSAWQETSSSVLGTASNVALGILEVARTPANKVITYPMYSSLAGGTGDNTGACNHYGVQGHSDNGERGANLYLDAVTGSADYSPLEIVPGTAVRVGNSTTITATLSRAATIDTTQFITDPGNSGYQAFAGVPDGSNIGGAGYEVTIDTVDVTGTTLTIDLSAVPVSYGNYIGYGYNNAEAFAVGNNTKIVNATWAAGEITFTTAAPHGLVPGDYGQVTRMEPSGWDVIPPEVCLAGTTGSTMVLPGSDGGTISVTGATWSLGVATYTTAVDHNVSTGEYGTISGVTPAGYNVSGEIVGTPTTTSLQIEVASDPGAFSVAGGFIGGGNIALNGSYGLARAQGLRGQVREDTIDHYSHRTGANLPRWQALQFPDIIVYSSTKSIDATLTELGLTGIFDGVYDYAANACYVGSGTSVVNQGFGANANYTLGDGGLRRPTYTGTPDSFSRTTYFASTGSAEINPASGANTLLADAHKAGAAYTVIVGGYFPASISANNYPLATCTTQGGSLGAGVAMRIATNRTWLWAVRGAAGFSVMTQFGGGSIPVNDFYIAGISVQTGVGAAGSYTYTSSLAGGFANFTPTYTSPTSGAAQSLMTMGVNGTVGTQYLQSGMRLSFMLVANNTFLSQSLATPLFRSLYRRQLEDLP